MANNTVLKLTEDYYPNGENSIYDDLFKQYGRVVIESLLTSFGLDMLLIKDQHGGDVDTIHNVRKIGSDSEMKYKNLQNEESYKNLEKYDNKFYHQDSNFRNIKHETRTQFQEDFKSITDEYTGKDIGFYGHTKAVTPDKKAELDHILGASEIHQDRGRILARLSGKELANSTENFAWTNKSLNASMGAWSKKVNEEYRKKYGYDAPMEKIDMKAYVEIHPELDEATKKNMLAYYKKAKKEYDRKLNIAYYTSPNFRKDLLTSSTNIGIQMGLRQAVGFLLTEVVFTVMDEFKRIKTEKIDEIFIAISDGVKKGFENAKIKYKELMSKFKDGAIAGIISSLTTTFINIFATTSKNIVRIIRQSWASLVEALKIIFFNPDNLPFGERMRAVAKIFATTASVIVSIIVREVLTKVGIASIPVIGNELVTFVEVLSMGLTSCTLLYFLDRSELVNKTVDFLNGLPTLSNVYSYYKKQAKYFEIYAAQVLSIDIESFDKEIEKFNSLVNSIEDIKDENELNSILIGFYKEMKIKLPWEGDFDSFMQNKKSTLVFE